MVKPHKSEIEQELKISLTAEDLEKVFKAFAAEVSKGDISHKYLPRAYFDTPDLDMYAAGVSLRVQYKPGNKGKLGSHEQTVKFELPPDAEKVAEALYRKECKDAVDAAQPDLTRVSDAEAAEKIKPFKDKTLKHIFTAAIERRFFNVEAGKGKHWGKVELAFDVGEISLPETGETRKFAEIEIEAKDGSAEAIHKIRDRIMAIAPSAKVETEAKSAQGSRMYKDAQNKSRGPV